MRETPPSPGLWGYNTTVWGVLMAVDDSQKMQRVDARGINGEYFTNIERPQTYGFTSVPKPPDQNGASAAEVVIGFRGGNRSHPFIQATDDRRYRPKNLQPGESQHHDDQGQNNHIARDGYYSTHKQHVLTAGTAPATTFELNEQLKGLSARASQLEHNLHGLFDVTSVFRQIVQQTIPAVAAVAPILNQDPSGLPLMAQAIQGKEMAYLQTQVQQALDKFLSPNIGGVGSVMGGADAIISALDTQIAGMLSTNPIVATVDSLVAELAALNASATSAVIAVMAPVIQGLIDSATASNPIIGQVADLRDQLANLTSAAGPGLNFLGPQQRLVQGLSYAMKLSQ